MLTFGETQPHHGTDRSSGDWLRRKPSYKRGSGDTDDLLGSESKPSRYDAGQAGDGKQSGMLELA